MREILDRWFSNYPEPHRRELRSQFRSHVDQQHVAAFLELTLHELLITFRNRVEIHPRIEGASTRPDFFFESEPPNASYLEAVLATDESREEAAAEATKNRVYDTINRLNSPDYFVGMDVHGKPETEPSGRQIRGLLRRELSKLNHSDIGTLFRAGGLSAMPRWPFEHGGWRVDFYPIPKTSSSRGRLGARPIGLQFGGFSTANTKVAIRNAVLTKASRYGVLEKPYIVAVNVLSLHVDETDVLEALYGDEQYVVSASGAGHKTTVKRARNGAWMSPNGPQNSRVSAILIIPQLVPSTLIRANACLFHNPWAAKHYNGSLGRLNSCVVGNDNRAHFHSGESMAAILGLPNEWPRD